MVNGEDELNGEDESELKQRRAQDLIETVAPPRGKRSVGGAGGEVPRLPQVPSGTDWDEESSESMRPLAPLSPDEIPTERPPWSDPAESRERLMPGVPSPPAKKNA